MSWESRTTLGSTAKQDCGKGLMWSNSLRPGITKWDSFIGWLFDQGPWLVTKIDQHYWICTCIGYHVYHNSNNETYDIYQFIATIITITAFEDGALLIWNRRETHVQCPQAVQVVVSVMVAVSCVATTSIWMFCCCSRISLSTELVTWQSDSLPSRDDWSILCSNTKLKIPIDCSERSKIFDRVETRDHPITLSR